MARKPLPISDVIRTKLQRSRVAHLATLDSRRRPHIVPICFVFDGAVFYTAIDRKPKRVAPQKLVRLRNIRATPQVTLVIDEYHEDWTRLWFILVRGEARLISKRAREERAHAIRQLRAKYPQYAATMLPDDAPVIRIVPKQITSWGDL